MEYNGFSLYYNKLDKMKMINYPFMGNINLMKRSDKNYYIVVGYLIHSENLEQAVEFSLIPFGVTTFPGYVENK